MPASNEEKEFISYVIDLMQLIGLVSTKNVWVLWSFSQWIDVYLVPTLRVVIQTFLTSKNYIYILNFGLDL